MGVAIRWTAVVGLLFASLILVYPAAGHADLIESDPPPNTALTESPERIVLYFTEPLEPEFSRILLLDSTGAPATLAPALIDPDDPLVMTLEPGNLPDGLYTISWRVLSTLDGHLTAGTIPFTIGVEISPVSDLAERLEPIPVENAAVRWLNVMSLALLTGSLTFWLLVWKPAIPGGNAQIERRLRWVMWLGWLLVGITGMLILAQQAAVAADVPLLAGFSPETMLPMIRASRFGGLWSIRMAAWLALGGLIAFAGRRSIGYTIALLPLSLILYAQSAFSHASAAPDGQIAVVGDFLHLLLAGIWFGGLAQLVAALPLIRRIMESSLGNIVGMFSNVMRVAVAGLMLTGIYSGWLQVGTLEGLFSTTYGQTLIIKILLSLPLLGIAAVNLLFTARGLQQGNLVWAGRLRRLVAAEITLLAGVLAAVGLLTALAPARGLIVTPVVQPTSSTLFLETATENDLQMTFAISPGQVGENSFVLRLADEAGKAIDDASLIRLRFEHQTDDLGESELRPEAVGDGTYEITGTNLSVPGEWRIRVTIQRPGQYDTVLDFKPTVAVAPPPPKPLPSPTADPAMPYRIMLLLAGTLAIAGMTFLHWNSQTSRRQAAAQPTIQPD